MKKWILLVSLLCLLLCGCSLQETSRVEIGNLGVYKYDVDNITLLRKIQNNRMYIHLDQLNGTPQVNVMLYTREGELLAQNTTEGIFKSEVELEFSNNRDELTITERMTYYNKNDRENNFTYDKITKLTYQDIDFGFIINVPKEGSKDIKWSLSENIKSIKESSALGVYNLYEVSYVVGLITIFICSIISAFIIIMKWRFSLLREKKYKVEPVFTGIIAFLMFILAVILAFSGEPVIIVIVVDALLIIPFIIKLIILLLKLKDAKQYDIEKEERMKKLDDLYHYKKNK